MYQLGFNPAHGRELRTGLRIVCSEVIGVHKLKTQIAEMHLFLCAAPAEQWKIAELVAVRLQIRLLPAYSVLTSEDTSVAGMIVVTFDDPSSLIIGGRLNRRAVMNSPLTITQYVFTQASG